MPDRHDIMVQAPHSKLMTSSPLEKVSTNPLDSLERPQIYVAQDECEKQDGVSTYMNTSSRFVTHGREPGSDLHVLCPYSMDQSGTIINSTRYESSLFSSSFSEIFNRKLRLPENDSLSHQPDLGASVYEDENTSKSFRELDAPNIGNLLPDEEDLLSGVIDELGHISGTRNCNEVEEYDLFSSGGGMELEGDNHRFAARSNSDSTLGMLNNRVALNSLAVGEQPSRSILISNVDSSVDDTELRNHFEHCGDIRALYTACRHQGFILISYYDIRAARNAMKTLQNKPLRGKKLVLQYLNPKDKLSGEDINHNTLCISNLASSISVDELHQIFGAHGEIKEISEAPYRHHDKFIEFYDIRAAETALRALNNRYICGKKIKLERCWPGVTKRSMQIECSDLGLMSRSLEDCIRSRGIGFPVIGPGVTMSHREEIESFKGLHSSGRIAVDTFSEGASRHGGMSVPSMVQSPVVGASSDIGNCLTQHSTSLGQVIYGSKHIPNSHSYSVPECHSYSGDLPCNSMSRIRDTVGHVGGKMAGGSRTITGMNPNGQPLEPSGGVFGRSGNLSSSLNDHQCMLRNKSYQQHPSSPTLWPHSSVLSNAIHAYCPPKVTGFPGVPPHLMSMISPVHRHHLGSMPAIDHSIWDKQTAYARNSPEASAFLGSPGTYGFSVSSPLFPCEIAPHNVHARASGNCLDVSPNTGLQSLQKRCHNAPGTRPTIAYGSPSEHARGFWHRRSELNSIYSDKKQYELDTGRILRGEDIRTTLMIKNIPNKYTSKMLVAAIDENHRGTYDFVYLPIDFKNKCNVGYAFINLVDPLQIVSFYQTFNGKRWEKFNSEKVASLAYARIQGKSALIAHFQNSSLMNEDKRCRPILFHTDGPNAGDQEPFPLSSSIRSRSGKLRGVGNEGNNCHRGSSVKFEDPTSREDPSSLEDSDSASRFPNSLTVI